MSNFITQLKRIKQDPKGFIRMYTTPYGPHIVCLFFFILGMISITIIYGINCEEHLKNTFLSIAAGIISSALITACIEAINNWNKHEKRLLVLKEYLTVISAWPKIHDALLQEFRANNKYQAHSTVLETINNTPECTMTWYDYLATARQISRVYQIIEKTHDTKVDSLTRTEETAMSNIIYLINKLHNIITSNSTPVEQFLENFELLPNYLQTESLKPLRLISMNINILIDLTKKEEASGVIVGNRSKQEK